MANLKIINPATMPGIDRASKFKTVNVVTTPTAGLRVHSQVSDGTHSQVCIASPRYIAGLKTIYIPGYVAP